MSNGASEEDESDEKFLVRPLLSLFSLCDFWTLRGGVGNTRLSKKKKEK